MSTKSLIPFLCAISALAVAFQGMSVFLASDFSPEHKGCTPSAFLNPAQAHQVYSALPTHKARHSSSPHGFLSVFAGCHLSTVARLDRATARRHLRIPVAQDPTLLAVNCMLTV